MIKVFIATLLIAAPLAHLHGEGLQLLLVPVNTSITPNSQLTVDVYIYNDSDKPAKAPTLENISTVCVLRDVNGVRAPRTESSAEMKFHSGPEHTLKPHRAERKTIKVDIPAEPGDLVEMYVEIGTPSSLRSKSILLSCPIAKPSS
jgi:hypothetical protein